MILAQHPSLAVIIHHSQLPLFLCVSPCILPIYRLTFSVPTHCSIFTPNRKSSVPITKHQFESPSTIDSQPLPLRVIQGHHWLCSVVEALTEMSTALPNNQPLKIMLQSRSRNGDNYPCLFAMEMHFKSGQFIIKNKK